MSAAATADLPAAPPATDRAPEPLERLIRPPAVEAEIRGALRLDGPSLLNRVKADPRGALSPECLVHLIRRDLRGPRRLVEDLVPILLRRAERSVRGALGRQPWAEEAREEILGRLVITLISPGPGADFFEVRFDLALKRLRIDVCRQLRRRQTTSLDGFEPRQGTDLADARMDVESLHGIGPGRPLDPEDRARLSQALRRLDEAERRALVLRHLVGLPVAPKDPGQPSIARLLNVSERTVRNLLLRARRKLEGVEDR
ncbi:MAG: sigma-70 family RNA polymerase sigma factor [Acidobacteriota bacterium]